jgi:phosphate transport system ATP-binding protein
MVVFNVRNLNVWFGAIQALREVNMQVLANEILGVIGPANSGKTSFLRMLNRMNELQPNFIMSGSVDFASQNIMRLDVEGVRRRIGMVFALPLPLPLSIFDNICYGVKMQGFKKRSKIEETVELSLKKAYLWDEVKDRLQESAFKLSGGQQQRLCIARTLAVEPEVILFDEPCSGLDPISTAKVEEAMIKLRQDYTMVLVTNNVKQAARVADRTAFFLNGELIEVDKTDKIFTTPSDERTDGYIRGKFG